MAGHSPSKTGVNAHMSRPRTPSPGRTWMPAVSAGTAVVVSLRLYHPPCPLDDGLRRGVELLHDLLHLGAGEWRDGDARGVGVGEELRVGHGGIEGGAQGRD